MNEINLLPKEFKLQKIKALLNVKVYSICVIILVVIILGLACLEGANQILNIYIKSNQSEIDTKNQEIAQYQEIQEKADKLNQASDTLATLQKDQVLWSQVIKEIALSTPPKIQVSNVITSGKDTPNFKLAGNAASMDEIIKFINKLEASDYFQEVVFVSSNTGEKDGQTTLTFNLTFNLEKKR